MIFVDSSFWIALFLRRDLRHTDAATLMRARDGEILVTSNHVRGETWTYLRRRAGHFWAVEFLDSLDRSRRTRVHSITPETEALALQWLRRHDERDYSFVDATSFALMHALAIHQALAFDCDFSAAGFVELRA